MIRRSSLPLGTWLLFFLACAVLVAVRPPAARGADDISQDEKQIRELVRKKDAGEEIKSTEDSIFVAGPVSRPLIGKEQQAEFYKTQGNAILESRPNMKRETRVMRVVVAKSGDLAYEYSDFTMSWDSEDKKRTTFEGSYLRVWRKVNEEWLEEAFFARPNRT